MSTCRQVYQALLISDSPNGGWGFPINRPIRAWKSVILPSATKFDLLSDIQEFLSEGEKRWYGDRGESPKSSSSVGSVISGVVLLNVQVFHIDEGESYSFVAQIYCRYGLTNPDIFYTAPPVRARLLWVRPQCCARSVSD